MRLNYLLKFNRTKVYFTLLLDDGFNESKPQAVSCISQRPAPDLEEVSSIMFDAIRAYGQTPLCEQVGQLVLQYHQRTCYVLARQESNKLYNLLGAGLARAHLDMLRC
jgi:hypothetical protein